MRIPRFIVALAIVAAAVSAACTGAAEPPATHTPDAGEPTPTATAVPGTATPVPTATPTPPPPEGLTRGGFLRIAVPETAPHMDVHQTVSPALIQWGPGLAYSRLFRYQSGPGVPSPNTVVECDLCESWEQIDSLTFRVTIRDDARWQSLEPVAGRAVTAHDVVFSYERQATPGWPNAPLLSNLESVTALDDRTVEMKLEAPDAEFLERLADGHSKIVAPEAVEQSGDLLRGPTVGSGPWVMDESLSGGHSFSAFSGYYEEELPYMFGLDVVVIPDATTRVTGLRNRLLDVDQSSYEEVLSATERFQQLEWTRVREPGSGVEVALNTDRAPLDSLDVRQAILGAWDPWQMIEDNWDGEAFVSVGLPAPAPDWLLPDDAMHSFFGDRAGASDVLEQVPAEDLTVKVGEFGPQYIRQAEAMAEALSSAGMPVMLERITTRSFSDDVWIGGDYDIFVGAPPPVASLTSHLFAVYHSDGPWNTTGFSTPELDALIDAQAVEPDREARRRMALDIQRAIMEGAHRFNVATRVSHWMWWPHVHDFNPNLARGENHFLTKVWMTDRPQR
ncbi:MAG: ABC transporter substrate-binding protein [Dehalococcoidia bacterium]